MVDLATILKGPASITGGGVHDPFIEDQFESGDEAARPQFTKPRRKPMTLTWPRLTLAEKDALVAFRESQRTALFQWTHPVSGAVMTCRFMADGVSWDESASAKGFYVVKAVIKEIV